VSLVARHLEENGLPTVLFSTARDITAAAGTPRVVFTNYPLGNACGRPGDPENQREILRAGLRLLESATRPGEILETPHVWSESRDWMRLIFTDDQPFLSEEAEQRRQRELAEARAQRAPPKG
jgi:hypothetical protein